MSDPIEAAFRLVRELELRLRELIAGATARGEYEQVARLATLTSRLGTLLTDPTSATLVVPPARLLERDGVNRVFPKPDQKRPKKVSSRAADYPCFYRQGDSLVKVGWSTSKKSEYTHRVSKAGVNALVQYLTNRRSNQFPINVDTMVDALRSDPEAAILGYQVYIAVAWLKEHGWLVANGRHGYTLQQAKGVSLGKLFEEMWASLPSEPAG